MKIFIISLGLLLSCLTIAQTTGQQRKDSLRNELAGSEGEEKLKTYGRLTNIYFAESGRDDLKMDTLLALYREYDAEALRQKRYDTQGIIRTNILGAYNNRNERDEIFRLAPGFLNYLSKQEVWQHYYAVYRAYLQARLQNGEYDKTLEGAQLMYKEALQRKHDDGIGMALYVMSSVYGKMSRPEEEERYMREAIGFLKKDNALVWLTAQAYFRLCNVLRDLKRYDEVLETAKEFEAINYLYEELSKSKQPTTWMNLWRVYVRLYLDTQAYDKADIYCGKLDSMGGGLSVRHTVANARTQIYYSRKQYDEALEMADKVHQMAGEDPNLINESVDLKIMVLCSQKGVEDIYDLFKQSVALRDSIRDTEFNSRLDELRTQYEVDKITAEKERLRLIMLFALGGCLFLLILLGFYTFFNRLIWKKNRALFRRIKEQDSLTKELETLRNHYEATGSELSPVKKEVNTNENIPGSDQQRKLVARLHDYLLTDRNFVKPGIDREELLVALSTNRTYLYDAVKAVTGKTLQEYTYSIQLDAAKQLLENRTEYTIEAISDLCGFSSVRTFYRIFRDTYQVSPSVYRKMSRQTS